MNTLEFVSSLVWPAVAVFCVIWLSVRHRSTMDRILDRMKKFKLPGGAEFEMDPVKQIQKELIPKTLEEINEADKEPTPEKRKEKIKNALTDFSKDTALKLATSATPTVESLVSTWYQARAERELEKMLQKIEKEKGGD